MIDTQYMILIMVYAAFVSIGLLVIFKHTKMASLFKTCIIVPILVWFGLVLLYVPSSTLGYPVADLPPDGSIIYSYSIREPSAQEKHPGIYLWVVAPPPKTGEYTSIWRRFDPRNFCKRKAEGQLRAYVLPYTRARHTKLRKKTKSAASSHGFLIFRRGGKNARMGTGGGRPGVDKRQNPKGEFDVINPPNGHELKDYEKRLLNSN